MKKTGGIIIRRAVCALTNMHLGGAAGRILTANETNWLHVLLTDDPGLFDGFIDRDDDSIFKTMWHGEFPGKLLTGIAQTYLLNNDPETKRVDDAIAGKLKEVQEPDGYLGPWKKSVRYEADVAPGSWGKWDTWGQYHFIAGGISIAAQNWAECNLAIGHAFALFYEETGEKRYLDAAVRIVDNDWNDEYPDFYSKKTLCCGWLNAALEGRAYYESGQPRWEGLYALETLASLYRITGEERFLRGLDGLWHGMRDNDRHNTGSFGTGEGATGDPFGAGSETCNTVAWMAFSTEYLKVTRDMSCCQANGNRGISQIAEWAVLSGRNELYLNYYGECSLETVLENGHKIVLTQETEYPADGAVNIKIDTGCPDELTLYFRIPSWSVNTVLTVNGEAVNAEAGSYCAVKRVWKSGDSVRLVLDMSPHFLVNDAVKPVYISVYYGPLLLAFRTGSGLSRNTPFNIEALRKMVRVEGDDLVNFRVSSASGQSVVLTDYYSAGKDGDNYTSWLCCDSTSQFSSGQF